MLDNPHPSFCKQTEIGGLTFVTKGSVRGNLRQRGASQRSVTPTRKGIEKRYIKRLAQCNQLFCNQHLLYVCLISNHTIFQHNVGQKGLCRVRRHRHARRLGHQLGSFRPCCRSGVPDQGHHSRSFEAERASIDCQGCGMCDGTFYPIARPNHIRLTLTTFIRGISTTRPLWPKHSKALTVYTP